MAARQRAAAFFVFVGLFLGAYTVGTEMPVSDEEAAQFLEEFQKLIEEIDALGIFQNNAQIAIPMFIPGFGIGWGLFSAWQTGFAFAALATAVPAIAEIPPLTILLGSSFGLMELVAYSIGMSRSVLLIHKIIKRNSIKRDAVVIGIEVAIVVGLLLMAAFLESAEVLEQLGGA